MILGHQQQWKILKDISQNNNFSHAYLFTGKEKLGKKKLALEWISTIFRENLQTKRHPDLILVEPEVLLSSKKIIFPPSSLSHCPINLSLSLFDEFNSLHPLNKEINITIIIPITIRYFFIYVNSPFQVLNKLVLLKVSLSDISIRLEFRLKMYII